MLLTTTVTIGPVMHLLSTGWPHSSICMVRLGVLDGMSAQDHTELRQCASGGHEGIHSPPFHQSMALFSWCNSMLHGACGVVT